MSALARVMRGAGIREKRDAGLGFDEWVNYFNFGGLSYPFQAGGGSLGQKTEEIDPTFQGFIEGAFKSNGIIFACMLARQLPFSEARFQFRRREGGRPGELFGSAALKVLETPWTNATTGNLLARMIQDADLAGNFFGYRTRDSLHRMRPDWVTIMVGSESASDDPGNAIDAEVAGYLYHPGGHAGNRTPIPLLPERVVHFAPTPDPGFRFRGISWLGPVIEEIMGDKAAMTHKRRFFEQGATPNMVVTGVPAANEDAFRRWVTEFKLNHEGAAKAYKTLFLSGGADAKVIGSDMKQVDFKVTQGSGETRVCAAARVPPIMVGLSEGLEAATYSNYGQARRAYADTTLRPLWREAAGSLAPVVAVPAGAELWYDDRDIPFLAEDVKDEAAIGQVRAATIHTLIAAGFEPASAVAAVNAGGDFKWLKHTGLVSVQLFEPGKNPATDTAPSGNGTTPPVNDDDDPAGRALRALLPGRN